jgi:hypothetical protein
VILTISDNIVIDERLPVIRYQCFTPKNQNTTMLGQQDGRSPRTNAQKEVDRSLSQLLPVLQTRVRFQSQSTTTTTWFGYLDPRCSDLHFDRRCRRERERALRIKMRTQSSTKHVLVLLRTNSQLSTAIIVQHRVYSHHHPG